MKIFIVFMLSLFFMSTLMGQSPEVSAESWSATKVKFSINGCLSLSVEGQLRLKSIGDLYDRSFSQAKIEYRFWSVFEIGCGYRYINQKDQDGLLTEIENHQRWNYSIAGTLKLKRFSSKLRAQYQSRREILPKTNKFVSDYRNYWRIKATLKYDIKSWKLDPKIGCEFFLRSANHQQGQFNKYRWSLSTTYKLNGPHQIGFGYLFEKEFKKWNPKIVHIAEVQYLYTFKYKTKKFKDEQNTI